MKNKHSIYLLLLAPVALWAQSDDATSISDTEPYSDVVVVEEVEGEEVILTTEDAPTTNLSENEMNDFSEAPDVVEIPDAEIEGASMDIPDPQIPEVQSTAPVDTEVVLELPGQGTVPAGTATMSEEETISVDFPDEDVRTILRNVADLFDLNLVIPDTLQGRTSIKLRNVTWRQVFEEVLEPLGFTYVENRNILRVKSIEDLTTEPVDTRVFVVNYAQAKDLQGSITPLVDTAAGGRIQVDVRSNALVITERPSRMNKIQEIIERLDRATDQVMIESKFVEVRTADGRDLGIDWSSLGRDGGVGLSAGNFVSRFTQDSELTGDVSVGGVDYAFDGLTRNPLDTAVFGAEAFTSVLRALQTKNDVKLVSNPTVVTMDNEKAEIKISREYPQPDFTFNAQTGQRQFDGLGEPIDVGITLEVTPSVNAAGFITLDIFPEVSSTSEDRVIEGTAFPIRDVRTARTRITIKDGFTLALGGLVSSTISDQESRVPLLGDIPWAGRLFRNNSEVVDSTNLIIFITARTLNPDGTDYRQIIDPRVIDHMGITPDDVPGYTLPAADLEAMREVERLRQSVKEDEARFRLQAEANRFEQEKLKAAEAQRRMEEANRPEAEGNRRSIDRR